jgi:hypothetical protein
MRHRHLRSVLGALVLGFGCLSIAACASDSVPLNHVGSDGKDNCYLSAFDGKLVIDPTAGIVFAINGGRRLPVVWPAGWTARRVGSEIEVFYPKGTLFARTNTPISPEGGMDSNGNWDMCGFEPLPPAG